MSEAWSAESSGAEPDWSEDAVPDLEEEPEPEEEDDSDWDDSEEEE